MGMATILIVEDEFVTSMALHESLHRMGHKVVSTVSTGDAAVVAVPHFQPELILMDIFLEGSTDGVAAAQRIKAISDVPVVYVTAHTDPDTLKRVIYSMPYGFIAKPFVDDNLKDVIDKALARYQAKKNL